MSSRGRGSLTRGGHSSHYGRYNYRNSSRRFNQNTNRWNNNRNTDRRYNHSGGNPYIGNLDPDTKRITKTYTYTYSLIHHLENIKTSNPWKRKVEQIINNIRIPGGPLSNEATQQLLTLGEELAMKIKDTVNEHLESRLIETGNTIEEKHQNENTEKVDTAFSIMKNRIRNKYKRIKNSNVVYATADYCRKYGLKTSDEIMMRTRQEASNLDKEMENREKNLQKYRGRNKTHLKEDENNLEGLFNKLLPRITDIINQTVGKDNDKSSRSN